MIYLASPYSHPDPAVRQKRFEDVCQFAAALIARGLHVFSPIAHSHQIASCGLPLTWEYWQKLDRDFLIRCDQMWVLGLEGWSQSVGIKAELEWARELGKPVKFVELPKEMRKDPRPR